MRRHIQTRTYMHAHIQVYACMHVSRMYACMHVCTRTCMCLCVYLLSIHTHTHTDVHTCTPNVQKRLHGAVRVSILYVYVIYINAMPAYDCICMYAYAYGKVLP